MDATTYDTKEGIAACLNDLDSFNNLVKARREAGYKRHERLHQFWILGRFQTDACGNTVRFSPDYFAAKVYATIPAVLTNEEFELLLERSEVGSEIRSGNNMLLPVLPPSHLKDPISGEGWTIATCYDAEPIETHPQQSLQEFVGRTWAEYKQYLAQRSDGLYSLFEESVFNEAYVDLRADPENHNLPKNEYGYRPKEEVTDSYIIQPGDQVHLTIVRFYHAKTLPLYYQQCRAEQKKGTFFQRLISRFL